MIKFISHRGNLYGPKPELENNPTYIEETISKGYDCEIDAWFIDGSFYLGHDEPTYKVEESFFNNDKLWVHAKNLDALTKLRDLDVHCFWHQSDDFTLTSRGYIWTYPGKKVTNKSIIVIWGSEVDEETLNNTYGICADYVDICN